MNLSERKSITCKRNSESEGSNMKRMKLADDDSDVLLSLSRTVSSSSSSSSLAYSVSNSDALSDEDNYRSCIISSGCSSEIVTDTTRLPFLDLEDQQVSETEISTFSTNNLRKQAEMNSTKTERKEQRKPEKSPTEAELEDFFSTAERKEHKRFTEKYNYDIANDTPLEGRYQWVTLKP